MIVQTAGGVRLLCTNPVLKRGSYAVRNGVAGAEWRCCACGSTYDGQDAARACAEADHRRKWGDRIETEVPTTKGA